MKVDEIALKKGHRDFVTIMTAWLAAERVVILGVLTDRQKDSLVAYLRSIPSACAKPFIRCAVYLSLEMAN